MLASKAPYRTDEHQILKPANRSAFGWYSSRKNEARTVFCLAGTFTWGTRIKAQWWMKI
jgi:hypothetical protein